MTVGQATFWVDFANDSQNKCIKECSICGEVKIHKRLWEKKHRVKPEKMIATSRCHDCMKEYKRQWRKANPHSKHLEYMSRKARRKRLVDMKGRKCLHCGLEHERFEVYDFHHRDPSTKLFSLSSDAIARYSFKKLQAEADKCDLLCAICHRIETCKHKLD